MVTRKELAMGEADFLALGDWNAVCYECGKKKKASTLKKHWQGYWVCPSCWEPRHPQDFVRAVQDVQTPPWVQPYPSLAFVINKYDATIDIAIIDIAIINIVI